jgi:hypothetical protein
MSKKQIERAYRKLWEHMTAGDGYQPYGYDLHTLAMTHPGFVPARNLLRELWLKA